MAAKDQKNYLSRLQARKVENWLDEHWPRIAREGVTQGVAAQQAGAALGFKVTPGNIQGAMYALEKSWPTATGERGEKLAAVPAICWDLMRIMDGLGIEPSDPVRKLGEAYRDGLEG